MPTRDGDIKTNDPWTLKSKNSSKRRDMVTEQQNPAGPRSKNPGSTNKERPHVDLINRNSSTPNKDVSERKPIKNVSKGHNARRGSKDLFGEKSVNSGATSKNRGSAPQHPEARINSGRTKVKTYPSGRNRGRNYKS